MKKRLLVFALAGCLVSFAAVLPGFAAEQDMTAELAPEVGQDTTLEQVQPTPETPDALEPSEQITPAALPSCFSVHGTACTPPATRHCLLAPYEPEICVCQSDNTWKCLWWF